MDPLACGDRQLVMQRDMYGTMWRGRLRGELYEVSLQQRSHSEKSAAEAGMKHYSILGGRLFLCKRRGVGANAHRQRRKAMSERASKRASVGAEQPDGI